MTAAMSWRAAVGGGRSYFPTVSMAVPSRSRRSRNRRRALEVIAVIVIAVVVVVVVISKRVA